MSAPIIMRAKAKGHSGSAVNGTITWILKLIFQSRVNDGSWLMRLYRQLFCGILLLSLISYGLITDGLPTGRTHSLSIRGEYVYWIRKYVFGNKIIRFEKRVFTKAT